MQSKLEDAGISKNDSENFMPTQNPALKMSSKITSTRAVGSTSKAACPFSVHTDWTEIVLPKYETNKDKFLVSFKNVSFSKYSQTYKIQTTVTMSGPNNQMITFRETLFLAIKLNRTIIPPIFFKHGKADPSAQNEVTKVENFIRYGKSL